MIMPEPDQLAEWIVDCVCVAEIAERRRDWGLYRDAVTELRALLQHPAVGELALDDLVLSAWAGGLEGLRGF